MPAPTEIETHKADEVARLTSRYVAAPVTSGMASALGTRAQQIEDDFWTLLNGAILSNHPMGGGPWNILDQLGAIVGVNRGGLADADYVTAIQIKIKVNTSNGHPEDLLAIVALLATGAHFYEWPVAAWEIDLFDTTAAIALALITYLGEARPAGTLGELRYSIDATALVTPGYTGGAGGIGFGYTSGSTAAFADLRML